MKILFHGWRRVVKPHHHTVVPVSFDGRQYHSAASGALLKWHSAKSVYGRLDDLGLSGRFLVEMRFERDELENWIDQLISEDPAGALDLLTRMQGKAVKQVLARCK